MAWSTDRDPNKTIQRQLGVGNADNRSTVRGLLSARALVLGSQSIGLGKMVQEPRAWFDVSKWGVLCHPRKLQISPARFKSVYSDSTLAKPIHAPAQLPQSRQRSITCNFGVWKSATRTKQTKFISTSQSEADTIWLSTPRRFRGTRSTFYIHFQILIK